MSLSFSDTGGLAWTDLIITFTPFTCPDYLD